MGEECALTAANLDLDGSFGSSGDTAESLPKNVECKLRPEGLVDVRGKEEGGRWRPFRYVPHLAGTTHPIRLLK